MFKKLGSACSSDQEAHDLQRLIFRMILHTYNGKSGATFIRIKFVRPLKYLPLLFVYLIMHPHADSFTDQENHDLQMLITYI